MKLSALILSLFLLSHVSFAQRAKSYEPLLGYDFKGGEYALLFIGAFDDTAFYVNAPESLIRLQKSWHFDQEAVTYPFACNDGFQVLLLDDDGPVEAFSIRLRCQAFVGEEEWWHYPGISPVLIPEVQALMVKDTVFTSLQQARNALKTLQAENQVVYINPPAWERYEGFFHFNVPNPNHSGKAPTVPWQQLEDEVRQQIDLAYPEQPYQLELSRYGYGQYYPEVGFKLTAHKSYFDQFKLYPISDWGWRPLPLKLTYFLKP